MRIAIVGFDVEGQASYRYYSRQKDNEIVIYDEAELDQSRTPSGVTIVTGPLALDQLKSENDFDLVLRTPGMPLHKLLGVHNVSSATKEFLKLCPATVIGVTGTKGKGTTSSLIHEILKADGKKSWLIGNIGSPALDVLDEIQADDFVVYEMSSFQLWDVNQSPQIAVVLMIEPDHLDRHISMDDYLKAKANIRKYQQPGDICLYYPDNENSSRVANTQLYHESPDTAPAKRFGVPDDGEVFVASNTFFAQNDPICETKYLRLPGKHNLMNACAAISTARAAGNVTNEAVARGLAAFEGLPHRLKFVGLARGVAYYDDSIATTPGSAIAAIDAFDEAKVLILGGSDKGVEYDTLIQKIAESDSMRAVICIGQIGEKLARDIKAATSYIEVRFEPSTTMDEIVRRAEIVAQEGDVVILSPAAASFDMFKSYADRGDQFIKAVQHL